MKAIQAYTHAFKCLPWRGAIPWDVSRYEHVDFVWVSGHWDYHQTGLCRHAGELCWFVTIDDFKDYYAVIYRMGWLRKLNRIRRWRMFELSVGKHWTYPHRLNGERYRLRRPYWLHRLLQRIYYRRWNVA